MGPHSLKNSLNNNTMEPRHWCGTCAPPPPPSSAAFVKDVQGPDISGEWDTKTRHAFESWTEANFKKGGGKQQAVLELSPVEWERNRNNVIQSLKTIGATHIVLFLQQRRIRFYL